MPAYVGSAMVIRWIQAAATTLLNGDYRTINYDPSIDWVEETAGADTAKIRQPTLKDGKVSFAGLLQGAAVAGGTVMTAALVEGALGTLEINPIGTAATNPKYTIPAYSEGCKLNWQYKELTEVTCSWIQNGLRVEGTN